MSPDPIDKALAAFLRRFPHVASLNPTNYRKTLDIDDTPKKKPKPTK